MKNERYYYGILSKEEKAAYRMIYNGIKMRALNIVVPVYLPPKQIQDVYLKVLYDNPIFYYINQTVIRMTGEAGYYILLPEYLYTNNEIEKINQDIQNLVTRRKLVPIANIGSTISYPVILLGIIFGATGLLNIGIILFSAVVVFQLVTLPVEFDASKRACAILEGSNRFSPTETEAVKKVLSAAAMTYLASALNSILQLMRLLNIARRR